MTIVHVGWESGFLSFAADSFERCAPAENRFFLIPGPDGSRGSYDEGRANVTVVGSGPRALLRLLRAARRSDMVVAHGMTPTAALAFLASRRASIRVWSGWGFDYYGTDESSDDSLLGPRTLAQVRRDRAASGTGGRSVTDRLRSRLLRRAAGRTDVFSAPIPSDLDVFRRRYPAFRGVYRQISYASVESSFAHEVVGDADGNILLGNSATASNNHFDAFEALAAVELGQRKIVTPLSYGDAAYRRSVVAAGEARFGSAFVPLVDFMPLDEYLALVGSCNVVIMNHKRQQAIGNICAAIYGGAHVYLDGSNPALAFLRSLGAVVHATDDLGVEPLPDGRLPAETVEANRAALLSYWSAERVEANVRELLGLLSAAP